MVIGAATAFFAASVGLFQNDIKKVIAYSTMSQLAREYIEFNILRHQTICVGVIRKIIINSQITKAHNYSIYNYISINFFNSSSAMRQYWFILSYKFMSERWKIVIISQLVGISEAIRLILVIYLLKLEISYLYSFVNNIFSNIKSSILNICRYVYNEIKYKYILNIKINLNNSFSFASKYTIIRFNNNINCLSSLVNNISDSFFIEDNTLKPNIKPDPFFEWLAGVIDGNGHFTLTKKGSANFKLIVDIKDISLLYEIKHKFGGSIRSISNYKSVKYKLNHKKGILELVYSVNGLIRNPSKMVQMNKLCLKYGIDLLYPKPLTFNNGWLSGFIDSDGSIYMNEASGQVFISATQKNKYLLEPLIHLYGGRVDILSKVEAFKYIVYRKNELYNLIDNYFNKYPLRTKKSSRLKLIKQFYLVCVSKNNKDIEKLNKWVLFKDKWEKYND